MIPRTTRSTLFPTRRSSDLRLFKAWWLDALCVEVGSHRFRKRLSYSYFYGATARVNGCYMACNIRSEEHTSELQSRPHLVCRLLLEKKKKTYKSVNYFIS